MRTHRLRVEEELGRAIVRGPEFLQLIVLHRDRERAGALEVAVEAEVVDGPLDLIEILLPQPVQLLELLREAVLAVDLPVGEARLAETPVATGCRPAERLRLQEGDPGIRVPLFGLQGGPQARVAAADHREVDARAPGVPREGGPIRQVIQPERAQPRTLQGRRDDARIGIGSVENSSVHTIRLPKTRQKGALEC